MYNTQKFINFFSITLCWLFCFLYITNGYGYWTKTYHFSDESCVRSNNFLIVEKIVPNPFTEILVSWNSAMPKKGFLRFFLEIFDEKKSAWVSYKMYEWGPYVCKSFFKKNDPYPGRYSYVRFECPKTKKNTRFRIKVEACDGAHGDSIRNITACVSDIDAFFKTTLEKKYVSTPLIINDVPVLSQHKEGYSESSGWCSPASLAQIIQYYTHKPVDLVSFARQVFDTQLQAYGSWACNIAAASVYLPHHTCYLARLNSLNDLIGFIRRGIPVIVSIYCIKPLPGAPKAYEDGHLIVVVGIDMIKREIMCHDTAEKDVHDVVKWYPLEPFMKAWDSRRRLAYIIEPI